MTGSTELGFAQPVHIARCVPFDLGALREPLPGPRPVLEIRTSAAGDWKRAVIQSQLATGAVELCFDDDGSTVVTDLGNEEYRWLC